MFPSSTPRRPSRYYVYVFVRQDLPIAQQLVQSNHATLLLAAHYGIEGTPNLVLCGVPDQPALHEVESTMAKNAIPHYTWFEPDWDYGLTAIATAPLEGDERAPLAKYQLWNIPRLVNGELTTEELEMLSSFNCKTPNSKFGNGGAGPSESTNSSAATPPLEGFHIYADAD